MYLNVSPRAHGAFSKKYFLFPRFLCKRGSFGSLKYINTIPALHVSQKWYVWQCKTVFLMNQMYIDVLVCYLWHFLYRVVPIYMKVLWGWKRAKLHRSTFGSSVRRQVCGRA